MTSAPPADELRARALQALLEPDPQRKVAIAQQIHAEAATIFIAPDLQIATPAGLPGCPARPELCSHLQIAKRSPFTAEGLAALLHAVTHIEFNAINLVAGSLELPGKNSTVVVRAALACAPNGSGKNQSRRLLTVYPRLPTRLLIRPNKV